MTWITFDCRCETANISFADGGSAPIYIDCKDHKRENQRCRRIPERVWCLTWQLSQAAIYAKTRNLPVVVTREAGKGREHSIVCSTSSFPLPNMGKDVVDDPLPRVA